MIIISIKKDIIYTDTTTGEVIKYLRFSIEKEILISLRKKARFIKSFASQDSFPQILKKRWSWVGYWLYLQRYHLEQHTNLLIKIRRPNYEYDIIPMETQEDIAEVLNVSLSTTDRFINLCFDNNLIKKGEEGYFMNPFYGYNGRGIHPETCLLFIDSKELWDALTPLQVVTIKEYKEKLKQLRITEQDKRVIREFIEYPPQDNSFFPEGGSRPRIIS